MQLQFKTKLKLSNEGQSVNIQWNLLNEEIADQCSHSMDFILGEKSIIDIIAGYENIAKQSIFRVIDTMFPGLYQL